MSSVVTRFVTKKPRVGGSRFFSVYEIINRIGWLPYFFFLSNHLQMMFDVTFAAIERIKLMSSDKVCHLLPVAGME